jgi:hypothetical protein
MIEEIYECEVLNEMLFQYLYAQIQILNRLKYYTKNFYNRIW